MSQQKVITLQDDLHVIDELNLGSMSNLESFRNAGDNFIVVRDGESGEIKDISENLITLRGRAFALEKLFGEEIHPSNIVIESVNPFALPGNTAINIPSWITNPDPAKDYVMDLGRQICLFSVGNGSTEINDWFNPLPPSPEDTGLANIIPFRRVPAVAGSGSLVPDSSQWDQTDKESYFNPKLVNVSGTDYFDFYAKRFSEIEPRLYIDISANRVYRKLELSISPHDCRVAGQNRDMINELSLIIARQDRLAAAMDDPENTDLLEEIYSRVTFRTEAIYGNKSLLIEYYTYA